MCIIAQSKDEAAASCASMLATLMVNSKAHLHTHSLCVYYSIAGNFCWRKILQKYVQALQKNFLWFLFPWNDYMMLCMTTPHVRAELVTLNNEAKKQAYATMG